LKPPGCKWNVPPGQGRTGTASHFNVWISMFETVHAENNPFRTWIIFCEFGMEIPDANVLDLNLMLKTPFFLRVKAFQCLITTQLR
jgi:hypothetical protein